MSDTPRTAAALGATLDAGFDLGPQHRPLVELCRELERELAALQAERDALLRTMRLIAAQDQGCGGNVSEAESWRSAQSIARAAIDAAREGSGK